jgi:hypothetical protein
MEITTITPQEFQSGKKRRIPKAEADRIACALISTHIQDNWPDETIGEWMDASHNIDINSKNGVKVLKAINEIQTRLQRKGRRKDATT